MGARRHVVRMHPLPLKVRLGPPGNVPFLRLCTTIEVVKATSNCCGPRHEQEQGLGQCLVSDRHVEPSLRPRLGHQMTTKQSQVRVAHELVVRSALMQRPRRFSAKPSLMNAAAYAERKSISSRRVRDAASS